MRQTVLGFFAVAFLSSAVAAAQPAPTEATPPPSGAPAATPDTPETPPAPPTVAAATAAPAVTYAVGTRLRGLFVPAWFLEAFMKHAHSLNSFMWGVDFTRRKGSLDIVVGVDVGWYGNFKDANWTGNDESGIPGDTYWTEFRKFIFTSIDINWLWHHDFNAWLAFRAGGGVGIGFLGGNYYKSKSGMNCTEATIDSSPLQCGPFYNGPNNPPREKEDLKYYRVLPVVSAIIGFRFKVHRHFVASVEGGFHNGFFFGGSGQYVF